MIKLSKETVCFIGGAITGAALAVQCCIVHNDRKETKYLNELKSHVESSEKNLKDIELLKQIYETKINSLERIIKHAKLETELKEDNKGLMS